MHAGRPAPTPTPRPTPTSTPLTCPCPTTPSTTPPAAPTISFTSTDSCPPEGAQASDSVTGAAVFFTAQVQFEEPVQGSLTPADFGVGSVAPPSLVSSSNSSANCSCGTAVRREPAPGAGVVTGVTQLSCTTYSVRGYMPQTDPFEVNSTTVLLQLNTGVASVCSESGGPAFPAASQLVAVDHRPIAKIYATQMSYPSGVPTTTASSALFLVTFSKPVVALNTTDFTISGPSGATARLMQYPGSDSVYRLAVDVPTSYCGPVTVSLTEGSGVQDPQGQALCPTMACSTLTYTKSCSSCSKALVPSAGIEVIKPLRNGGNICV
ncbi:hypothetical protein ABBQ38_011332 [Trebouxia sp. C0009 RCD-2024]